MKAIQIQQTKHARSPRLETIQMVENAIQKYDGEFKKYQLWKHLPKKMMYQTFCRIIDYLLHAYKISIDAEGKVGWIYYPESARYWHSRKDLSWSKPQLIKDVAIRRKK